MVELCRADPDLLARVDEREESAARDQLRVEAFDLGMKEALPELFRHSQGAPAVGLFILEGVLLKRVRVAEGTGGSLELLGAGDVLRPWQGDEDFLSVPATATWEVLLACRLAVLDRGFERVAARWPEIQTALGARLVQRANSATLLAALRDVDPASARVEVLLWHLSDRWGRRGREGVIMPLNLKQGSIGELVGISRQWANRAIGELEAAGRISRKVETGYMLLGRPPTEHEELLAATRVTQ